MILSVKIMFVFEKQLSLPYKHIKIKILDGMKTNQRTMTFTKNAMIERFNKELSNCKRQVVSNSQILLINHVPLSILKDFSDNVGTFLLMDYVFLIVRKGQASFMVDSVEKTIVQGNVGFATIGTIACITDFSDDVDITCIIVDTDEMWLSLKESMPIWMVAIANTMNLYVNKKGINLLDDILNVIHSAISTKFDASCHTLRGLIYAFVHEVDSNLQKDVLDMHFGTRRQVSTVAQFMQLVKHDCFMQHGLNYYAHKLYVSPQHLCNLVKDALGVSAKMCIDKTMILQMKKLIICDRMSTEEVSKKMNFVNTSTANRFFKRMEGITLKDYEKFIVDRTL